MKKDWIKKDWVKKLIVALVFIAVLIGSLFLMSFVFAPTNNYPDAGTIDWEAKAISAEPKNSIDVLFLGNSEAAYGFTPMRIWEEFGIPTYNCGGPGHPLNISDDYLHRAFERQSPKIVFLETDSTYKKSLFIWRIVASKMVSTFSVLTYHNRWKDMDADEVGRPEQYSYLSEMKGYKFVSSCKPTDASSHMLPTSKSKNIFYRNRSYLKNMKAFCEAHGAKLVLVSMPSTTNWNTEKHNGLAKFAESIGLEYIDMNYLIDEIGLNWEMDSYDGGDHMNVRGAEKVSAYLGQYLADMGIFENKKENPDYAQWNEALQKYNERKTSELGE